MRFRSRRGEVPADVVARAALAPGDRVLAGAPAADGSWVLGSRRTLVLLTPEARVVLPWEEVEDAAWDRDEERLRITATGEYGRPRPTYTFSMEDPALLLQLVRERVTASVVLQRRVPVHGRKGLTVIGRRSPAGGPVRWMHAYDAGVDPADPEVVAIADLALQQARAEVGETPDNPI